MDTVALIVAVALASATLPFWLEARRSGRSRFVRGGALALWGGSALALGFAAGREGTPPLALRTLDARPLALASDGYLSSNACQACHPAQYDSWHDTYHRTMAQLADERSVLAPFDGRQLGAGDQRCVPFKRGDELWVELRDPYWTGQGPAPIVQRQIVQTTGSHHQQLYWFASGQTRALGLLPFGYRIDVGQWRPIDAIFLTPPHGAQSTVLGRWNSSCQKCHATHGQARFQSAGQMDTRVTELGIACEMCHGPAEEHARANRDPLRRYRLHDEGGTDPTIVDPSALSPERSTQVCGQCHSVSHLMTAEQKRDWAQHGFSFRPGDDLLATRGLGEPDADQIERKFWSDGMLRVSGREYNSLARTPCFQAGQMSCLSCHRMHQAADDPRPRALWKDDLLAAGMDGDRACTQCHARFTDGEALRAHTHHAPSSSGSRCLDCHMPYTTYGLLGAIRNHEVRAPEVATSVATGRPNACNQCHLDKSLGWTARWLHDWYGKPEPALDDEQRSLSAAVLWTLRGDAGQRALMAWSFGWEAALGVSGSDWRVPYLALLMNDRYHAVRFIAARSAASAPEQHGQAFDDMAEPAQRVEQTTALLQRWAAGRRPEEPARPELLLGTGGLWLEDQVERLLAGRDDADMVLQE